MPDPGPPLKVGLIDSGVNATPGVTIAAHKDFTGSNTVADKLGHGTTIAGILGNNRIALLNARVFDRRFVTSPRLIAAAVNWLAAQNVRLINMSFGLADDRKILREACQQALACGIVLVAATPAQGQPVYPAAWPSIIRATGDARCQPGQIAWLHSRQADFGGHPGTPEQPIRGASSGCAWVSRGPCRVTGRPA